MKRNKSFKKRLFYIFSVALLSFSSLMLVGCSGGEEEAVQTNSSGEEIVELTWYMIGTPQKDLEMVIEAANEYTAEKIGVTVDMVMIDWGDYDQKMQTMISSGEEFDICFTSSWAANYAMNASNGAFVDITEMMEGSELEAVIDSAFIEGATVNGSLYAVPANKEVGEYPVLVFNQDMADKYGITEEMLLAVDSIDDLGALFEVIHENEPDVACMAWTAPLPVDNLYNDENPIGMVWGEEDFTNKYNNPEVQAILTTMHEYYEAGYMKSDVATNGETYPYEGPQNWFCRKEFYQPGAEEMWENSAGYNLTVVPIYDAPVITTGSVTGSMQAISVTSDHPEEAFEYLTLLNTDPYLRTLIDYGIEGVHYEDADGDGFIEWLPAHENYMMPSFALGNMFILPLVEGDSPTKWEDFAAFNEAAVESPTLGFYFDPSEVQNEIAAISSVAAEYGPSLLHGVVDPAEYIPQMNEKLEDAGIDKVLEEVNKQYDEWLATKGE